MQLQNYTPCALLSRVSADVLCVPMRTSDAHRGKYTKLGYISQKM